ncbi:4Fe-4S binding protein [Sediminispirochaeta smaragdinae]|jgi:polyferredoxin|uniref:Polyferredoxin n=1 Tax=Sediminispirochaeta smaragdinae (strain DSM 11293 / JCM 15392 / SEBR 4228) TaxID=573413 RepID=E1RBB5_SEDSS|nr:4Fe-4S binding protein [Sediminispirochaeta smaragdinae]ADK79645.1 polyferredoxin [Sediminispirochaeta smaragdinae DSM 11293]
MKQVKRRKKTLRTFVQIFFFIVIALITVNHALEEKGMATIPLFASASTHAVCPFGGVVTLGQLFTSGTFISKIHESSIVLMIAAFLIAILFGPAFCGWVCPFGTVQEFVGKIGKKIFGNRYNRILSPKIDRPLRFLRYVVLLWVLYSTTVTGKLIFADYDPYYALFNFWSGEVAISGIVILFIILLLSLLVERPFCKYACPYGALLGLFNLVRIFGIRRRDSSCINCKACDKACPMNITVSTAEKVRNHQCISCLKCTSEAACPVPRTVEFAGGGKEA